MIESICPQTYHRYTALPVLGPILDDFTVWLSQNDYPAPTIRTMLGPIGRVDEWLIHQGICDLTELDALILEACRTHFYRRSWSQGRTLGGGIRALARYLEAQGVLRPTPPPPLTPRQQLLATYTDYLARVRGLAPKTISGHSQNTLEFLDHLDYDAQPECLGSLNPSQVEAFVRLRAGQLGRGAQQHLVAHLRSFLRFLATTGQCPSGLDTTIDTPRLYRLEKLPRALSWDTVEALLESIDRETPIGLRDYTMLFLIASYGLRVGEVAALTLDHLHWREGWLQVPQGKTRNLLKLPLTDRVAETLMHYLRHARPDQMACRALFLRSRTPIRSMSGGAVSMIFDRWAKRSGLAIPFSGAHCLRHAYAVHLLRTGASFKTIGDLLGHRFSDSTYVYLRLATEELREVALPLPTLSTPLQPGEH
jgi:site-specific recombinase XerD